MTGKMKGTEGHMTEISEGRKRERKHKESKKQPFGELYA